jgi:hypothetical protein
MRNTVYTLWLNRAGRGSESAERSKEEVRMADTGNSPSTPPQKQAPQLPHGDFVYCSDPSCKYCRELREAKEQIAKVKPA